MPEIRGLFRVRWIKDGEPELQCSKCMEFWAFDQYGPSRLKTCKSCREAASRPRQADAMRRLRRRRKDDRAVAQAYDADFYRRNYSTLARALRGEP